jgi:hypothetical protein
VKDLAKPAKCGLCRFRGAVTWLVTGAVSPQDCQRGHATVWLCRALRLFVVADRPELRAYEIQLNWTENGPLMWKACNQAAVPWTSDPVSAPWGKYRRRAASTQLPSIDILSPRRAFFLCKMAIDGQVFVRLGWVCWLPGGMPSTLWPLRDCGGQGSSKRSLPAENVYRWSFDLIATFR